MPGEHRTWVITGTSGSGKTAFCQKIIQQVRLFKWDAAGILCPAVMARGEKIAIDALEVRHGIRQRLAQRQGDQLSGSIQTQGWQFYDAVLSWGNTVFQEAVPCDLLVVDELGPLELENHKGWISALEAIQSQAYHLSLVVIRPGLIEKFRKRCSDFTTIELPLSKSKAEMNPMHLLKKMIDSS